MSYRSNPTLLAPGLRAIENVGVNVRRAVHIDLGGGYSLLFAIGRAGPERIEGIANFWHLVPLEEESRAGWILNGPFRVDPGRTQIAGAPEENAERFRSLGQALGRRLIALYDAIEADWPGFAERNDIDPAERRGFWRQLVRLFAADLEGDGLERHLHGPGRGLGALVQERPVLDPGTGGGLIRAGDAAWQLAGALADPANWSAVRGWPAVSALAGTIGTADLAALLAKLGLSPPRPLTLRLLLERFLGVERQVSPELAAICGAAITPQTVEQALLLEKEALLNFLQGTLFVAEDGSWQPIFRLSFPSSLDAAEQQRAAFVAPDHRLSADYSGDAAAFAAVARSRGYSPTAHNVALWAATAGASPQRQQAFLRYLLTVGAAQALEIVRRGIPWLPPLSELAESRLLHDWTAADRSLLLLLMGHVPPGSSWLEPHSYAPPDALGVLEGIYDWWLANGNSLRSDYFQSAYPEDFDPDRLRDGDDLEAWFTMFALAAYHTIGRSQAEQPRNFIARAMQEGWWQALARSGGPANPEPWTERLRAWSDPNEPQQFMPWRRCVVDLHTIARYLPDYVRIFQALPLIVSGQGEISLRALLDPPTSSVASEMDIVAAMIQRSLGIGAGWLVRELYRHGIFTYQAELAVPYGWCTTRRVRRLLRLLELRDPGRGVDEGRLIHETMVMQLGVQRARFAGDLDLPLQLITKREHRAVLEDLFAQHGGEYRPDLMDDDDE
jgi:hypothetical protein